MKKLGVLLLLLGACSSESIVSMDQIMVAVSGEPVNLDPFAPLDGFSLQVRAQIFESLITLDQKGDFTPTLATEWVYKNPTTIIIKLKEGIFFHNGEKFTAQDVKYTIERQQTSIGNSELYSFIKSVETPDELTVVLNLHTPFAPAFAHLALPNLQIVNKKAVDAEEIVGTGPYILTEWLRGNQVIVTAFDQYHGGKSTINKLIFRVIPDEASRFIALETGEVQIAREIIDTDVDMIAGNPDLVLLTVSTPNIHYLSLNTKRGVLTNLAVRQALSMSIDRKGILVAVYGNQGREAASLLPYNVFGFDSSLTNIYDPKKAKQIIQDLGLENTELKLYTIGGATTRVAEILQSNFKEIGVDLSINILELATYLQFIKTDQFDIYLSSWTALTSDADYALDAIISTKGSWNNTRYANSNIDANLLKAKSELDPIIRKKYYENIQQIVANDIPYIPLFTINVMNVVQKNLKNITQVSGSSILYLGRVSYEDQ